MVKLSGGSRTLTQGSKQYNSRQQEFNNLIASGDYSAGYFSQKGGGYYVVENSTAMHKPEELEAARFMADKGYRVTLIDESNEGKPSKIKTPDGKIFSASFEQRTPDGKENTPTNIANALRHSRDKRADIAVIFQKYGQHSRSAVEEGIKAYEEKAKHRFKQIFIITKDGRIHRHKHN